MEVDFCDEESDGPSDKNFFRRGRHHRAIPIDHIHFFHHETESWDC